MDWIGAVPGKRESRRLAGDCILRRNDPESGRVFPDQAAYGGRRALLEGTGNHHRHRVHAFEPTTWQKVRIELLAANAAPEARVCEVRLC
jgi:hypothetical protein